MRSGRQFFLYSLLIAATFILVNCENGGSSEGPDPISLPLSGNLQLSSDGSGNYLAAWTSGVSVVSRYYDQGNGGQDVIHGQGTRPRIALTPNYGHIVFSQIDEPGAEDIQGTVFDVSTGTWRIPNPLELNHSDQILSIWPALSAKGDNGMMVFQLWGGTDIADRQWRTVDFVQVNNPNFPEPLWNDTTTGIITTTPSPEPSRGRGEPHLATNVNREAMLMWTNSADQQVYVTRYYPRNGPFNFLGPYGHWPPELEWSFRHTVLSTDRLPRNADIQMFANSDAMIVWTEGPWVLVNRYDSASNTWASSNGKALEISNTVTAPIMATHDSGFALVAVHDSGRNNIRVYHYFPNPDWDAAWQTPITLSSSNTISGSIDASIAPDGQAMVVWQQDGEIHFSAFDGTNWQAPIAIGTGINPKVAMENNGDCLIVYENEGFIFDYQCNRPVAEFTYNPGSPIPNETVFFDASASTSTNGSIINYEWDFDNDGNFDATGVTPSHTYTSAGNFTARLRITTDLGSTDEFSIAITVGESVTLTVNTIGDGTLTSNPLGIDCGLNSNVCTVSFPFNTSVQLTATPEPSFSVNQWGGDCVEASGDSATIIMDSDKFCSVSFTAFMGNIAVLTTDVTIDGVTQLGGGIITSTRAGIECGSAENDCEEGFIRFTDVLLTATPNTGYRFQDWSGDCNGTSPNTSITMSTDLHCVANFASTASGDPIITVAVNGGGQIISTDFNVRCLPDCEEQYPFSTNVILSALAFDTTPFQSWEGDCNSEIVDAELIMDSNKHCVANFLPLPTHNRLRINVVGAGTVISADGGIVCLGDCTEDYTNASQVNLLAIPNSSTRSPVTWGGECNGVETAREITLTLDSDIECTVTFPP